MDIEDIFEIVFRQNAFRVSKPEDLDVLRKGLEENFNEVKLFFQHDDDFEKAVMEPRRECKNYWCCLRWKYRWNNCKIIFV